MRCTNPTEFSKKSGLVSCGQCMNCRVNRQKEWITRLVLEYRVRNHGVFVTLTYSPEELPGRAVFPGGSVWKKEGQKFIKRVRKYYATHFEGRSGDIRYFLVGEYGNRTHRAHYHAVIFGVEPHIMEKCVNLAWKKGFVQVSDLAKDGFNRFRYTCGYVLKKLLSDASFDDGRHPEFAIMSKGLGKEALYYLVDKVMRNKMVPSRGLTEHQKWILESEFLDLGFREWNGYFKLEGQWMRLDKYLSSKLFDLCYPHLIEKYTYDNEHFRSRNIDSPVWKNKRENNAFFRSRDALRFVTGEEYAKEVERSIKLKRKLKEKRLCSPV